MLSSLATSCCVCGPGEQVSQVSGCVMSCWRDLVPKYQYQCCKHRDRGIFFFQFRAPLYQLFCSSLKFLSIVNLLLARHTRITSHNGNIHLSFVQVLFRAAEATPKIPHNWTIFWFENRFICLPFIVHFPSMWQMIHIIPFILSASACPLAFSAQNIVQSPSGLCMMHIFALTSDCWGWVTQYTHMFPLNGTWIRITDVL